MKIRLSVVFIDDRCNDEEAFSADTEVVTAANLPASGLPTISGTAQVGQTLTAETSGIADEDGLTNVSYSYQWTANDGTTDADILNATASTYTLSVSEVRKTIEVKVSFTDDAGNGETLTSAATEAVSYAVQLQIANTSATGVPTISGEARVGQTLTADTSSIADADGLDNAAYNYRWLSNDGSADTDIQDATAATYTLAVSDAGRTIKVRVSFTDDAGNQEYLTSAATAAVAATAPDAPQHLNVSPHDNGALDVSWEAPASDGGSAVTGYRVQWKEAADSWDTPADVSEETVAGTTHTITVLTDGVEYAVRVIASNEVGDGPASDGATGTPRETTPPELSAVSVDGATLTLTYDEALDGDSEPETDAFAATVSGDARGVDGVSVDGSSVTLTLASAVTSEDTVTVSYTEPADAAASRIQDLAGNAAPSFGSRTATNNTAEAVTPLTAWFEVAPSEHDGTGGFTFELRFSEEVELSYVTLRDESFEVTGGTVVKARRLAKPSNIHWQITVEPDSNADVAIALPADRACDTEGAICTEDGKRLFNRPELTVAGPPLTASLENTSEAHNGTDAFTFELRFSEEVELSYVTLRDESFEVTGGTVVKARRLAKPSNVHWEIMVEPDSNADVAIALPTHRACDVAGAICTADGKRLSNRLELTVSGPDG